MHDAKTILSASLTAVLMLSFSGIAFAEVTEDVRYRALEGKHVWEKLEYINGKTEKTQQDRELEAKLEAQFEKITAELNYYGIASPLQWEADPDHWRMKNAPPMSANTTGANATGTDDIDIRGASPEPCFCPQEFRFITGFDYKLWGFWPTSAFSDEGFWSSKTVSAELMSTAATEAEHGYIIPFSKLGMAKQGFANIKEEYSSARSDGTEIDSIDPAAHTITKTVPDHKTVCHAGIKNPPIGTDIQIIVDLPALS